MIVRLAALLHFDLLVRVPFAHDIRYAVGFCVRQILSVIKRDEFVLRGFCAAEQEGTGFLDGIRGRNQLAVQQGNDLTILALNFI